MSLVPCCGRALVDSPLELRGVACRGLSGWSLGGRVRRSHPPGCSQSCGVRRRAAQRRRRWLLIPTGRSTPSMPAHNCRCAVCFRPRAPPSPRGIVAGFARTPASSGERARRGVSESGVDRSGSRRPCGPSVARPQPLGSACLGGGMCVGGGGRGSACSGGARRAAQVGSACRGNTGE